MNAITTLHARRAVSIRPISTKGLSLFDTDRRATHATVTANYLYVTRQAGRDALGRLDFRHRGDLVAHGLELPANHPRWAEEDSRIWREADAATVDLASDAVRAWHVVVSLPEGSETTLGSQWCAIMPIRPSPPMVPPSLGRFTPSLMATVAGVFRRTPISS